MNLMSEETTFASIHIFRSVAMSGVGAELSSDRVTVKLLSCAVASQKQIQ